MNDFKNLNLLKGVAIAAAIFVLLLVSIIPNTALAFDWVIEGNVTVVEPSYMPGAVVFQMSAGAGSCPAGTWLFWENPNADNNKAVYSGLLSVLLSGKRIRFHGVNAGCKGQYIHLLP